MNVLRGAGADFFVDVTLSDGAVWDATGLPTDFDLTFTTTAPGFYTETLLGDPTDSATATYSVVVAIATPETFPTGTFTGTGLAIKDVNNVLAGGGTISITLATRDAGTGNAIDVGTDTDTWITSSFAVVEGADGVVAGTRTVDVATARLLFDTSGN